MNYYYNLYHLSQQLRLRACHTCFPIILEGNDGKVSFMNSLASNESSKFKFIINVKTARLCFLRVAFIIGWVRYALKGYNWCINGHDII